MSIESDNPTVCLRRWRTGLTTKHRCGVHVDMWDGSDPWPRSERTHDGPCKCWACGKERQ